MLNSFLEQELQLTNQEEGRRPPSNSKTVFAGTTVTISALAVRAAGARWSNTFRNLRRVDRA
jgi:hypothetical protein